VASGRAGLTFNIETRGIREIERALDALPTDALVRMKARTKEIGRDLADRIKAAGRADTRQSARAAATVRFRADQSGGTVKAGPHDLLFGSEFGIRRRTGWYAASRYRDSQARQFRPWHQGSYWFFRTAEAEQPRIEQAFRETVDQIVNDFRPG
jgi:hypothetical protein